MNEIINLGNGQFVKVVMLKGEAGSSIQNIAKTSTSGLVDTYTITLTDGSTKTFTVTNGKGISSITKTGTSGLVDTYTITFNDETTQTFNVTNGNGIVSVSKTSTVGLVDTYTITFDSGDPVTFTVTNGADGVGITSITKTGTSGLVDTYTITFTDGTSTTFDVTNGANGQDVGQSNLAPVETGNTASQSYAVGSHLIWNGIYYEVTQAIASGGTFVINSNIKQTTIEAILQLYKNCINGRFYLYSKTVTSSDGTWPDFLNNVWYYLRNFASTYSNDIPQLYLEYSYNSTNSGAHSTVLPLVSYSTNNNESYQFYTFAGFGKRPDGLAEEFIIINIKKTGSTYQMYSSSANTGSNWGTKNDRNSQSVYVGDTTIFTIYTEKRKTKYS